MAREADVVRSLAEMAGTLVDDFDAVDLLTGPTDRGVRLLGVSAAGVMLASPAGRLGLAATAAPLAEADLIIARAFADLAALSIVQHRASTEAQRRNEQLSVALTSRVMIEQAKGVIAERAGTRLADAFSRLRAYARNHNLRLTDVARAAIDGSLDPRGLGPRASRRPVRSPDGPAAGEG